jgi:GT2 family glycosyltransferase
MYPVTPTVPIAYVVVNFNGGRTLARCLDSLAAQTASDFEVIVFDNGSTDDSLDTLESRDERFKLYRAASNLGFAEANNRAISMTRAPWLGLVNNDAWLDSRWGERMVAALAANPGAGAAAGRTLKAGCPDRLDSAGFAFYSCASTYAWEGLPASDLSSARHRPFGPVASAAVYARHALEEAGPFHPEYFCYYEDTDLAVRLVLHGFDTIYVPEALAFHVGSATGRRRSAFQIYHLRRNVEYLYWVDMVGALAWVHLPWHLAFESLAFARAIFDGQAMVVLKAKRDALRQFRWIRTQRKSLARRLRQHGIFEPARQMLRRRMTVGIPVERLRFMLGAREAREAEPWSSHP